MKATGDVDLLIAARSALLDALEALHDHLSSVIVIGAQAVYMHTGAAPVALAEATKDSDLALDARALMDQPLLEETMRAAGFELDRQPGTWLNADGVPVDLMVPDALAGQTGRRGARIPPHSKHAARRAVGLEAAVVDYAPMEIRSLSSDDDRVFAAKVAGPAALLVAKLHKLGERQGTPGRLVDKDAHDVYRLLVAVPTADLASRIEYLKSDELAGPVTEQAMAFFAELFAAGNDALGSLMAGRAEEGVGEPLTVSASVAFLAQDLLAAIGWAVG
ncbi:hypothetical protein GCM10029978_014330 [Actinoallomurus acanthiterrae]